MCEGRDIELHSHPLYTALEPLKTSRVASYQCQRPPLAKAKIQYSNLIIVVVKFSLNYEKYILINIYTVKFVDILTVKLLSFSFSKCCILPVSSGWTPESAQYYFLHDTFNSACYNHTFFRRRPTALGKFTPERFV